MKFRIDKKYFFMGIGAFLVICGSILFYYLLFHGESFKKNIMTFINIIMPVLDGFVVAYLLTPVLNLIEKNFLLRPLEYFFRIEEKNLSEKTRRNIRKISIILTLCLVFWGVYCFFSVLIPQITSSIQNIVIQFPVYLQNLNQWILKIFDNNPNIEATATILLTRYSSKVEDWVTANIIPQLNAMVRIISSGLIGSVISLAKAMWNLLIGFIISIYLLDGKEKFAGQGKKIIYSLFDTETANVFIANVRFIHQTFIGFIGGKILDSILIGIICYVCIYNIGTPYPVLISVIVGVTNVIPFFGPYLGAIPSAILILMVNPMQCLYFIIFIVILQQFDGNILGPKILGDSTGLNSFWVIFSITLFGGLFGIFGMIIGVPVFAVIYAGIRAVTNRRLEDKGLPVSTKAYLTVGSIENEKDFVAYTPISRKEKKKSGTPGNTWILSNRKRRKNISQNQVSFSDCEKNDNTGTEEESKS